MRCVIIACLGYEGRPFDLKGNLQIRFGNLCVQAQGHIFVGSILVSGVIAKGDPKYDPALIAKQYWKMYEERKAYEVAY